MCLSPEFDLASSVVIGAFAIDTIRRNENPRTIPLALVPSIFAIHTVSSAIVWLGIEHHLSQQFQNVATSVYIFIAFVLWPTYVPFALLPIEKSGWRKNTMWAFLVIGFVTSIQFAMAVDSGNETVMAGGHYLDFHVNGTPAYTGIFYFLTTCVAILLSGIRQLVIYGLMNAVVVATLAISQNHGLPSLWCLWAAVTSFCIWWFIRTVQSNHLLDKPWPWLADV